MNIPFTSNFIYDYKQNNILYIVTYIYGGVLFFQQVVSRNHPKLIHFAFETSGFVWFCGPPKFKKPPSRHIPIPFLRGYKPMVTCSPRSQTSQMQHATIVLAVPALHHRGYIFMKHEICVDQQKLISGHIQMMYTISFIQS